THGQDSRVQSSSELAAQSRPPSAPPAARSDKRSGTQGERVRRLHGVLSAGIQNRKGHQRDFQQATKVDQMQV
ncbi:hypothetical protein BGX31_006492, partial [Mortierella sp. GBA43]